MTPEPQHQRTYTPALLGLVWTAMFGFSAFFFSYSTMVSIAAVSGLSTVTGGSVLTTMMIGVIVAQPFAPWLGRVCGFKAALLGAIALQFLGQLIALLVAPPLLSLVLAGLCGGVGFGLFVVIANAAVPATTAPGRIGKALGFFGGITSLAAAVGAPLGLWLVGTIPITAFRIIVCACLLLAIPTVLKFMTGRSPRRREDAPDPGTPDPGTAADDLAIRSGRNERRSLRWAGRRAGEVLSLVLMLSPFLVGMIVFGIILGFGPGEEVAAPALFIAGMQVSAVIGRFVAGAVADSFPPFALNVLGLGLAAIGLVCAVIFYGGTLFVAMIIIGLGLGTMQSASLIMAFASVSTPSRASVAWNMNFDIGLAIAGVVGGLGFTYLGSASTFLLCALVLLLAGALSWIARTLQMRNSGRD
ncbi:MFS transporter [Brevibacterium spongiae]|uniref:MFS transporter n=1 Tax=Brevibacterium spongiae TaxID=2909672 RepID=A0ABY5SRS0_9MICO|nr:MFS transporter [Brevibacterium spongiae]UVI35389.1 MFS transporter [Brevibacterium spongiae]